MACLYIGTIPLFEDKECAAKRRAQNNANRADRRDTSVEKTGIRNERRTYNTIARNYGTGETPIEGIADSAAGALTDLVPFLTSLSSGGLSSLPDAIGGALDSLLGGGESETSSSTDLLLPVALGGAALLVVVLVVTSDSGGRR